MQLQSFSKQPIRIAQRYRVGQRVSGKRRWALPRRKSALAEQHHLCQSYTSACTCTQLELEARSRIMHAHGAGVAHQPSNMACKRLAVLLRYSQRHMAPSLGSMLSTSSSNVTGAGRCVTMAAAGTRQARSTHAAPQHAGGARPDSFNATQHRADGESKSDLGWRGRTGGRFQGGTPAARGNSRGGYAGRAAPSAQRGRGQGRGNSSRQQGQRPYHQQAPSQDARRQPDGQVTVRGGSALRPVAPPSPADAAALRSPPAGAAGDQAHLNTVSLYNFLIAIWAVNMQPSSCQLSAGRREHV